MEGLKMFRILNILESMVIIDGKRKKILYLENGDFEDITEKAKKRYEKDLKNKEVDNKYLLTSYYEIMINNSEILKGDTILSTENQKEFDKKIIQIQKEQLEINIKWVNYQMEKLEKDVQYYTYEYSNI
jgi:hypothetical protein